MSLSQYCFKNQLFLNAAKSKVVFFQPNSRINYTQYKFHINNEPIEQVSKLKFLGLNIDANLTFSDHTGHVIQKLSCSMFLLFKLRNSIPRPILLNLFSAVGLSHVYYADIIYLAGCSKTCFNQVESRYIDCGRIICFNRFGSSRSNTLKTLNWLPLNHILYLHKLLFIFKCIKYNISVTSHLKIKPHNYNTRNEATYLLPHANSNKGKLAFKFWCTKLWNELPQHIRNTENVNTFKQIIKKL